MPDQEQGEPGMLDAGEIGEGVEVIDDVLEVGDQGPLAVGATMAEVIVGVDDGPPPRQRRGHMPVAASMLGIAVHDEDEPDRSDLRVPASVEDPALRAVDEALEH